MKVILLEKVITDIDGGCLGKGTVIDLPPHIAQEWVNKGRAKFVPRIETATVSPPETTSNPRNARNKRGKDA